MRGAIIILALLTGGTGADVRAHSDTPTHQRGTPPRSAECWKPLPAVKNTHVGLRKFPLLPAELASKPVKRHAVALTLCIDDKGAVARSVVVISSGDKEVDAFYQRSVEEWKVKPAIQAGKPVPSSADVSVSWTPR